MDIVMVRDSALQEIRNFIRENFIAGRKLREVGDDESLIESGIIDSTGVLELVLFIEDTFHIKVEDDELVPENLDSISNVMAFLEKKGVMLR